MDNFNLTSESKTAESFLKAYGYYYANSRVIENKIFAEWQKNKAPIRETLRRHPNWSEEAQAVVFNEDYECGIDHNAIGDFLGWAALQLRKESDVPETEIASHNHSVTMFTTYSCILCDLKTVPDFCSIKETEEYKVLLKNVKDLVRMYEDMCDKFESKYIEVEYGKYISRSRKKAYDFFDNIEPREFQTLTDEDFVSKVNEAFPDIKGIVVGMKTSKAIGKICKYLGLDKIKDLKNKVNPESGEVTQKDYGYNYQFAMFADAINPLKVSAITCISINPFDYWTMSFGTTWASCHTIDKENYDRRTSTYEGQYSAGTESYMLDNSSVVFYTIKPTFEGGTEFTNREKMSEILQKRTELWRVPKSHRMMFHLAEDGNSFVYGRLYPDARDGGDTGLAAQFRNTFQKVISDCHKAANLWVLNKGTGACDDVVKDTGRHYQDYLYYGDCGYCYRKGTEKKMLYIGHNAICPECGQTHDKAENILCWDCDNGDSMGNCERCGCNIYEDDEYVYCTDDGTYYCCESCAERDDVHYCPNDGNYHYEGNCYWDARYEEWTYGEPEVVTEDGEKFGDVEDAYDAGYDYDEEERIWLRVEEMRFDDFDERYYSKDAHDWINVGDHWYHSEENAEADGNEYDEETEEWRAA